jgi:hypothetical protein
MVVGLVGGWQEPARGGEELDYTRRIERIRDTPLDENRLCHPCRTFTIELL